MRIRRITPTDDGRLARIVRANLEHYGLDVPGTAYFDPELDHLSSFYQDISGRGYFVLVDEEDQVLGGAGFAAFEGRKNCAELQKLYLDPSAQGQGLGYALIETVQQEAKASGYQELYLETHHVLAAAIHMYEKMGYIRIEPPKGLVHSTMDTFLVKALAEKDEAGHSIETEPEHSEEGAYIVVSACLLGENCKYNGGNNYSKKVAEYIKGKKVIPICPEVAGGLAIPRSPVELVQGRAVNRDGEDVTEAFQAGTQRVMEQLKGRKIECIILQSRSPSCGVRQIYDGTFTGTLMDGMGLTAQELVKKGYPVIDVAELPGV